MSARVLPASDGDIEDIEDLDDIAGIAETPDAPSPVTIRQRRESKEQDGLHGWALARNAFLSKNRTDAVDVWQAVAREAKEAAEAKKKSESEGTAAPSPAPHAKSESASALRAFRATRSRTVTLGGLSALSATAMRTFQRATSSARLDPTSPNSSRPSSSHKKTRSLQELLDLDIRDLDKHRGFFGSIRFPAAPRAIPSKFVRLAAIHDYHDADAALHYSKHVVDLALVTWKLTPPCAMISLPHAGGDVNASGGGGHKQLSVNSRLELVLRRGIAEAARKTGAWIFTSGSGSDAAARTAGRAMMYLSHEYGDSERVPTIGMLPWSACKESGVLGKLPNGYCHKYEGGRAYPRREERASLEAASMPPFDLDAHHSHFIMVDHEDVRTSVNHSAALRGSVEKYISDTDISKDNIQTPKVLLVIAGGASAFGHIRDQLDPFDPKTGTAVPVLVISDSGGAAEDIARYCGAAACDALTLPVLDADAGRTMEYVAEAREHLPKIKELGELTGQNSRQQLAFFKLSEDLDARDDLALEIEKAMLNDCPNIKEEALLAVKWKEPVILQQHLLDSAQELLSKKKQDDKYGRGSDAGSTTAGGSERSGGSGIDSEDEQHANADVDLLQVALSRVGGADVDVVRTILGFVSEPSHVVMDALFDKQFDRYPVQETAGMWAGSRSKRHGGGHAKAKGARNDAGGMSNLLFQTHRHDESPESSVHGGSGVRTPTEGGAGLGLSSPHGAHTPGGHPAHKPSTLVRSWSRRSFVENSVASKWFYSSQVLATVVDGYRDNLEARLEVSRGVLSPNWTDLMMWAVLSGQPLVAEAMWEKTRDPIRAALMASQLCRRLSQNSALRADFDDLLESADRYEDRALDLLDSIRDEADAAELITLIPWEYFELPESEHGAEGAREVVRKPMWGASPLESAAEEDGLLSVPCMRFISHRHSQYLLDKHLAGDFPGSPARIPQRGSSLFRIAIQIFLPFLPGTVVEVMPCEEAENVARTGPSVAEDRKTDQGSGGLAMDPDLVDVLEELAGKKFGAKIAENSLADLISDLASFRFLTFYTVPKVKFVMHLMQHLLFMALLTFILLTLQDEVIRPMEVCFWVWTLARTIGEFNEIDSFTASGLRLYARDIWNQMDMLTFSMVVVTAFVRIHSGAVFSGVVLPFGASSSSSSSSSSEEEVDGSSQRRLLAKSSKLGELAESGVEYDPGNMPFPPAPPLDAVGRSLYAILVVLVDVRIFQYLRYFQSLGVLSIVLGGVVQDVANFFFIESVLIAAFGVAFAVLQPGAMQAYSAHEVMGRAPLYVPFWGMFGEFDLEKMIMQVNDEKPTIIVLPLLLWVYMFVSSVILVNVLIAQMADTFSKITGEGLLRWQFERAQLISEFKETKPPLPPPLNVFWLAFITLPTKLLGRTQSLGGFKTFPTSRKLANLEHIEGAALHRCLLRKVAKKATTMEAQVGKANKEIAHLQTQNQIRFENLNGRQDQVMARLDELFGAMEKMKAAR